MSKFTTTASLCKSEDDNMKEVGRLYSVADVARWAKISRWKAYEMVRSGELKAFRLGSRDWRIHEDDLKDFLRSRGVHVDR